MRRDRRRKLSAVWRDGALGKAVSSTALAWEGHSTFGGQMTFMWGQIVLVINKLQIIFQMSRSAPSRLAYQ